jgi:hypothetical protein
MQRRAAWLAPWVLAGCASNPSPSPTQTPSAPPQSLPEAPNGGRIWRLDLSSSQLRMVAFRGGTAARLGHHHILQATTAEGWLWLPEQGLTGARGELRVPLADLAIDDPNWRREAGGEFNEKPVSGDDIAGTRRNLLASLQAQQHASVALSLRSLRGAVPWWVAEVAVNLAGREAIYPVSLAVQASADKLQTEGRLALRQSAHGLQPYSVLGGLLAVQDDVVLDFRLSWRSAKG